MQQPTAPGPSAAHPAAERVRAFMLDYDAQWQIAAPLFEARGRDDARDRFAVWKELLAGVASRHLADSMRGQLAGSFSNPPEYGPQTERIIRVDVEAAVGEQPESAYVLAKSDRSPNAHNEYLVRQQDGVWRIHGIAQHFGDPTQAFADDATIAQNAATSARNAPLPDMPAAQARLDETFNFTERDVRMESDEDAARAVIEPVGTLVTTSGLLAVLDFGLDNHHARPLARTVEPGSYPIERLVWRGRNAAVRVRFAPKAPAAWSPAALASGGHVVGVDSGSVCIVDYAAYASMTRRAKAATQSAAYVGERPHAAEISLGGGDVGIAVDSGYGDGGYPAYWGLDALGNVVQLVVDFMVLVGEDEDGVLVHK